MESPFRELQSHGCCDFLFVCFCSRVPIRYHQTGDWSEGVWAVYACAVAAMAVGCYLLTKHPTSEALTAGAERTLGNDLEAGGLDLGGLDALGQPLIPGGGGQEEQGGAAADGGTKLSPCA